MNSNLLPAWFEGPTEEIQAIGGKDEKDNWVCDCCPLFLHVCSAEAAIFDVTNVTELQNALTAAQSNGQDDTINLAAGTYTVSSRLDYIPDELENFSLTIQGAGAWATILDGGNSTSILRIEQSALSEDRDQCERYDNRGNIPKRE